MSTFKSFLRSKNDSKNKMECQNEDSDKEKHKSKSAKLEIKEEDSESEDSDSENSKKIKSDVESLSESIDEERITLGQINKIVDKSRRKREENNLKSLLNKKRHLHYEPIKFSEKKGQLLDLFCPSIEELNEFFIHCKIQTLSLDDLSIPTENDSDSKSFDICEWMKTNKIDKKTINPEELSVYKNNNKNIKKEIEISPNYEKIKEEKVHHVCKHFNNKKMQDIYDKLQTVVYSKILSCEQKEFLNELFEEMKNIEINTIKIEKDNEGKEKKLELVLDLDNTCIYSYLYDKNALYVQENQKKFRQKNAKIISFQFNNFVLYNVLILREGLGEFLKYVQPICNFHISTLGTKNYGKEIENILKDSFGIEFIGFKGKLRENETTKYISDLYIKKEKTLIFDDNVKAWEKDSENIIISKYFFDEECAMLKRGKPKENEDKIDEINNFLKSYNYIFYNIIIENNKEIDWKIQKIKGIKTPFYQFSQSDDYNYNKCFTSEYLNSKNYQFIYMKDVVKEIYLLKFVYDIEIPLAIKMIRISTLNNMKFDTRFLSNEERIILSSMIKACGGIIFEDEYVQTNEKVYLVVSKRIYDLDIKRREIKSDLEKYPYYVLINEKYILDTFYLCTNLKSQINDPEYTYIIDN